MKSNFECILVIDKGHEISCICAWNMIAIINLRLKCLFKLYATRVGLLNLKKEGCNVLLMLIVFLTRAN